MRVPWRWVLPRRVYLGMTECPYRELIDSIHYAALVKSEQCIRAENVNAVYVKVHDACV